jgi:hypothetical protein
VTIKQAVLGCEAVFKEKPKILMGLASPPPPTRAKVLVPDITQLVDIEEELQVTTPEVEVANTLPVTGLESQYKAHSIPALAAKIACPDSLFRLARATCRVERALIEKAMILKTPATIIAANIVNPLFVFKIFVVIRRFRIILVSFYSLVEEVNQLVSMLLVLNSRVSPP